MEQGAEGLRVLAVWNPQSREEECVRQVLWAEAQRKVIVPGIPKGSCMSVLGRLVDQGTERAEVVWAIGRPPAACILCLKSYSIGNSLGNRMAF